MLAFGVVSMLGDVVYEGGRSITGGSEQFGKAVRSPSRDSMLAQASAGMGRGRAFSVHEAIDQSGAVLGPLLVAAMVAISGYRLGLAVLAVPGALAMAAVVRLRRAVPEPAAYEQAAAEPARSAPAAAVRGFPARFWLYATFTA